MSESKPTPLDRESLSGDKDRMRAIGEVLRDQARREVLRDIAYRRRGASLRTQIVAAVLALAAFGAWVFPVPGLQPDIPFPIPSADEEAGLRLVAYIQAQQVEAFRRGSGRLPDILREAGEPLPGMTYERLDARIYRLSGATERTAVQWTSSDSVSTLLGRAGADRLRGFTR